MTKKSPRFMREVRISAGVSDPTDKETTPEDEYKTAPADDDHEKDIKLIQWIVMIILILLLLAVFLIWRCCCVRKLHSMAKE
jgi:uncharacterized membrane protein YhaH (DUF805 family)